MTHEQREEYIRQAKQSFRTKESEKNKYETLSSEKDEGKKSFWKVRLLIAVLLFVGFFSLHQNKQEDSLFSYEQLSSIIRKNIDVETVTAWFQQ